MSGNDKMLCISGPWGSGTKKKKIEWKISKRIKSSKTDYPWDSDFSKNYTYLSYMAKKYTSPGWWLGMGICVLPIPIAHFTLARMSKVTCKLYRNIEYLGFYFCLPYISIWHAKHSFQKKLTHKTAMMFCKIGAVWHEFCTLYLQLGFGICIRYLHIWNSLKWNESWWIILWPLTISEDLIL